MRNSGPLVQRYRGVTLVELMLALAVGSVLCFGIMTLFLRSKISALQDEELARVQENGRYALRLLSRELSMAGSIARLGPHPVRLESPLGTSCFNYMADTSVPIEQVSDVAVSGLPIAAGTVLPADCLSAGNHVPGTDMLLVRRTADAPVIAAGVASGSVDTDGLFLRTDTRTGVAELLRGTADLHADLDLWRYVPRVFFLRSYSLRRGDGIPTLCRRRLSPGANKMAPLECLIEGIENLQIEFGIDDDGSGQTNRYLSNPTAAQLRNAVVAQIYLLARSVHEVGENRSALRFSLGRTTVGAADDYHYRRLMQTTVVLRNAGRR